MESQGKASDRRRTSISKVSIKIKEHHPLTNICININGEPANIDILETNKEIELMIDHPYIIEIFANNAPIIPNDSRLLGLLITNIKIIDKDTQNMYDYPLSEVL